MFYVTPETGSWKQVWVTESANLPGGVKEKLLVERHPTGRVRFQGTIRSEDGDYWDRTTLTPLSNGTVRQVIEWSTDEGRSWAEVFAAVYVAAP